MLTIYRHAAVASGQQLLRDQTLSVEGDQLVWMGPDDEAPGPSGDALIVDAGGATIVPGLVDAHSHVVLPGGSHWIERVQDSTKSLLDVAEHNGDLAFRAGTRWFRDVGSPQRDGRALALTVRDGWAGRRDRPYLRAAGSWLFRRGALPPSFDVEVEDGDALVEAVHRQAEDGSDLVKLYLDGPDPDTSPWTDREVGRAVAAADEHGITVTAHSTTLPGAQAGVHGGVDCLEHGMHLDADLTAEMASRGTFLVSTLGVFSSWESFAQTTSIERFTTTEGRDRIRERKETAYESVRLAAAAGVRMAAGTDFGGGSLRANQMAWEVECLVAAGLQPWEALTAATRTGGELLREPNAGRLTVGGPADFFLVHGDPLEDPSALWRVWKVA
jgi:imidazolonepropionase-like amidohydrolase